ncbi:MAG: hypothetical protein HQK86_04765 [Nitrospinae bacterium]|nr:hypothetical protein [Nitrospinota bacterium]MBF0633945.1 hypothetical protein [Nitrospinota bacterium]
MSDDEKNNEKDMEILTRAIVDAITKSRDVREAIRRLTETDEVCSKSFMVLMLKVRSLAETMGLDFPNTCSHEPEKLAAPAREKKSVEDKQAVLKKLMTDFVDGKKLSQREMEFCEYLADNFDSGEWLKKHGLIL